MAMMTEEFARWFLAVFFNAVALFYILRISLLSKRLDKPVTYAGEPGSAHYSSHLTFRVFRILIYSVCVVRLVLPGVDAWLVPIGPLWQAPVMLAGCVILLASFGGLVMINLYMNGHWRSGTRPGDRTVLLTSGPYALSRNPMMMLVIAGQAGFFLALPSVFSLVCLVAGVWAVLTQTAVEQRALRDQFGIAYGAYAEVTPMWLFSWRRSQRPG